MRLNCMGLGPKNCVFKYQATNDRFSDALVVALTILNQPDCKHSDVVAELA